MATENTQDLDMEMLNDLGLDADEDLAMASPDELSHIKNETGLKESTDEEVFDESNTDLTMQEPEIATATDATTTDTDEDNVTGNQLLEQETFADVTADLSQAIEILETKQDSMIAELKELGKKLDDGEIGEGEYNAEKVRVELELNQVNAKIQASQSKLDTLIADQEQSYAKAQENFDQAVNRFMQHPENEIFGTSQIHQQALQAEINKFAGSNLSPDEILEQSRQNLSSVFVLKSYSGQQQQQQQQNNTTRPKRDVKPMPSVGSMPAVTANNDDGMEILNGKTGVDLEAAMFDDNIQRRVLR